MSHPQSTSESDDELNAPEPGPSRHAIVPSDKQQDLVFRSIRAIDPRALEPHGVVSLTTVRRTPEGMRPTIWVRLTETETSVVFEVTLHTGQHIQAHVPIESWGLGNCDSEAVRAALQMAYVNLIGQKLGPVIVRRGTVSAEIGSEHKPQSRSFRGFITGWRNRKSRRREKADTPDASPRKESAVGDIGGLEEGNRSGGGSGSSQLTYSESRRSASSYTSEKSASDHAAEPSTSTKPAAQETAPPAHFQDNLLLGSELSVSTAASPGSTHTRENMSTSETRSRTTTTRSASTVPKSKPLLNGSSAAATRIPLSLQAKMAALASKSQQASTSHANLNGNNATIGIDTTVSALTRASLNDRPGLNPNGSPALSTPGLGETGMAGRVSMSGMAARRAKPGLKLSQMQGFGNTPQASGLRAGRPTSPGPASRRATPQGDLGTPFGKVIDHVKEWRDRKRKRREKADKPGSSHRKERTGGDVGGREEGNRSGSGSGSGELTYSESRSSASSYTSERSASEHAAEPSTSTKPATQETVPPNYLHQSSQFGKRETSTRYVVPRSELVRGGMSGTRYY